MCASLSESVNKAICQTFWILENKMLMTQTGMLMLYMSSEKMKRGCSLHGPACIVFHCSHLYITNPGSVSHFAKT